MLCMHALKYVLKIRWTKCRTTVSLGQTYTCVGKEAVPRSSNNFQKTLDVMIADSLSGFFKNEGLITCYPSQFALGLCNKSFEVCNSQI